MGLTGVIVKSITGLPKSPIAISFRQRTGFTIERHRERMLQVAM
jgi:hypothetical protein